MTERLEAVEPVRKSLVVTLAKARAFELFTRGMDRWWPAADYHIGKEPVERVVLEPFEGGRWFELGVNGSECEWGRVLSWQEPERIVLAWQIDESWQYDPDLMTEVEVRFSSTRPGETLVELEHRGLERLGEAAARMKGIFESEGGWTLLLSSYSEAAATP